MLRSPRFTVPCVRANPPPPVPLTHTGSGGAAWCPSLGQRVGACSTVQGLLDLMKLRPCRTSEKNHNHPLSSPQMVYGTALLRPGSKSAEILRAHWLLGPAVQGVAERMCSQSQFYVFTTGTFTPCLLPALLLSLTPKHTYIHYCDDNTLF